jgi:single-strand DNA-binding protein
MNNCSFIRRLTKDGELRYTSSGIAVFTLNVAVQDKFKNQNGEYGVTFINLVAWKGLAEMMANHCKKGDQIGVVARYQQRSYENNDGKKVYISEFIVNELTFCQKASNNGNQGSSSVNNNDPFSGNGQPIDISDDDLPF